MIHLYHKHFIYNLNFMKFLNININKMNKQIEKNRK